MWSAAAMPPLSIADGRRRHGRRTPQQHVARAGERRVEESLAAEQRGAEALGEGDREVHVADGGEIRVALGQDGVVAELDGKDFAGDGVRQRQVTGRGVAAEDAHEERFARKKLIVTKNDER